MSQSAFRHTVRRRIAPIAFLLALSFLGARTCAEQMARVEVEIALGPHSDQATALRVDVFPEEATRAVISFERHQGVQGRAVVSFPAELDPGMYQLYIEVQTERGPVRYERAALVSDSWTERATIRVSLGP